MNPRPIRCTHSRSFSGGHSIGMPSASSTSALPQHEVTARLPCFTTTAPPAARMNMIVVETLNSCRPLPPVPQTSIIGPGSAAGSIPGSTARSISCSTKPAISSVLSPFACSAFRKLGLFRRFDLLRKQERDRQVDVAAVQIGTISRRSISRRIPPGAAILSSGLRHHAREPFAINVRRDFRWLDLASPAPEDVRVGNRNPARGEVLVDRALVLEQQRFVGAVRDRHDVDVLEFRTRLAPVAMRQDVMPSDFAAGFHFAARRHGPMEERVETRDAHAARGRLHMLEESGETADDLSRRLTTRRCGKIPRAKRPLLPRAPPTDCS